MWWWAPTNAHHCAIQPTITLTTILYCILQCTNNATSSCSKAINHKIKFLIITQKFPGGPFKFQEISRIWRRVFKFQEISRISRSCRHPVRLGGRHNMPPPRDLDFWPFDLEVACDPGYPCAKFRLPRPFGFRVRADVRDITDRRTDADHRLMPHPPPYGAGHNN